MSIPLPPKWVLQQHQPGPNYTVTWCTDDGDVQHTPPKWRPRSWKDHLEAFARGLGALIVILGTLVGVGAALYGVLWLLDHHTRGTLTGVVVGLACALAYVIGRQLMERRARTAWEVANRLEGER